MRTERSKTLKDRTRSLGRGRATPSPFFAYHGRKKVRRRGDCCRITSPHRHLAALLRMTCSNELRFYFLVFFGTPRTSSPTGLYGVCYFGCRGDHNVFEENLRLAKWSSAVYKNIIAFRADVQCTPLQICTIFVILIVGATTMFLKKPYGLPRGRPEGSQRTPLRV